ncbi:SIS domain-containing protein [Candidatus Fermentibacterales bacterium]|nr:SIS domain-containing protein [Candidatus Fermentibacterales bacterium]
MLTRISTYLREISDLVLKIPPDEIGRISDLILGAYETGRRVFVFGNGGGSATSAHFVCDLAKGTARPGRPRLKAISLVDNMPLLTAWANDTDYRNTFGEQLVNLVEEGDVVIGLSGSGMSPNVVNALRVANDAGAVSVLLSGFDGGEAASVASMSIVVPSSDMQQIEDTHLILAHIIYRCVRDHIDGRTGSTG